VATAEAIAARRANSRLDIALPDFSAIERHPFLRRAPSLLVTPEPRMRLLNRRLTVNYS
jgi:hypothetical protein